MKTVKVNKKRLLETLKENKKTHKADFEIVWEKYRETAIKNVTAILDSLKDPKRAHETNLHLNLSRPELHTDDFDRAIEMIDWEIDDEVELQEHEFQQYVQNNWAWMNQFVTTNQLYTGSVSPSKLEIATTPRPKDKRGKKK